ncbi:hypothetical protein NVP1187O_227 [Vibrio phage 1.187.O._10N.286.49.F1]|nr:hypothetical protein NVP1187O_227 [Vibrio phage 1.187.O._10N.286.49.F1]
MQVELKETIYCDASFKLEGLVVDVVKDGWGYAVLGSELIKHGAPLAVNIGNMGYDPEYYYFLHASEVVIVSQEQVTWEEAAQACNNIFKKYHNSKVVDYVQSCSNNALPHSLTQMMATALAEGLTQDDKDVEVMVDAYKQLSEKGYVGEQS